MPSAFCIDQIVSGFVVYYLNINVPGMIFAYISLYQAAWEWGMHFINDMKQHLILHAPNQSWHGRYSTKVRFPCVSIPSY